MRRYLIAGLTVALSTFAVAPLAQAQQTHGNDPAADLTGDGNVSVTELLLYNRDQRGS